jgi:hypothetical protein
MDQEIWKDIAGYEGYYQVSNHGRVKSCDRVIPHSRLGKVNRQGKVLSQNSTGKGYLGVGLSYEGATKTILIHRLVATTFCDGNFEGALIIHNDGDKLNNRFSNLKFCSSGEAGSHATKLGSKPKGDAHPRSKLQEQNIPIIRNRLKNGECLSKIAKDYGVSRAVIRGASVKTIQAFDFSSGGVRLVLARASHPTAKGFDSPVFHLQINSF